MNILFSTQHKILDFGHLNISQFLGAYQTYYRSNIKHLASWLLILIHFTLPIAVLVLVLSRCLPYERLHILRERYCSEQLNPSDAHLYTALCNSFESNPLRDNQPYQKSIYNRMTARFYFQAEVILLLKKNAMSVVAKITPISGSLAEKQGWISVGPLVDITVYSGNSERVCWTTTYVVIASTNK